MDLSQALQDALNDLQSGRPENCLRLCSQILAAQPGLLQAHYLRGCAAFEAGDITQSISDLEVVHANHPGHLQAAYYLGRSLRAAGRAADALAPLQAALADSALEVPVRYELATCLARLRRRPEAINHYRSILERTPGHAQVNANLASLLERENRLDEAESAAETALRLDPDNETALMTRAVLNRRAGRHVQAEQGLRSLTGAISNPINRSIAWNQLGRCLEGLERWDEAYAAFTDSNRVLCTHQADAEPDAHGPHSLATLEKIRTWLETEPLEAWDDNAGDAGGIGFLVGFPRSGTTLLDRMLSAHPDVEVLEEKSLFAGLHRDWSEPGTLESLAVASPEELDDARRIYRREMSRHRRHPERRLVIDKLPQNLAYLFLIRRLFPDAPVVYLQRHPLDACISCYFQAFELESSMAYFLDLADTARYYDAVMQVATLSMAQVSNPLHRLRYEDLVTEPESQLRALAAFLGLEWNGAMLDYRRQDSAGASDTPSYQQVSQPLYTSSIGRWRHYRRQLEPVIPVLDPWVRKLGYK